MNEKYLYLNTIGCQMNVYDSEKIAKVLNKLNYELTPFVEKADLIIVNTCSVREKAEQKVYSFLGRLAGLKRKKPDLLIGVGGCVAQQEGAKILERVPYIDLVFGTKAIGRLHGIIEMVAAKKCRIVDVEMTEKIDELTFDPEKNGDRKATGYVTIMQGCDNYCTYCVVPFVRGKEISRNPAKIIEEIEDLVASGVREVTLLGQNVNSYGQKEGHFRFSELLARVNEIEGLLRIRFTTSHPKDLSEDLIRAFKDLDKLCNHIHLPVQSGSDNVLKLMNRKYTRKLFLEKVEKLRNICPGIAITSDMIAGFPGETDADFEESLDLITTVEFDGLYAFKYSDRPNATAARFPEKVPENKKKQRLQRLLDLQNDFTTKKNKALVGSNQWILVEGFSKKHGKLNRHNRPQDMQWTGRTSTNKIVNFIQRDEPSSNENIVGQLINVQIVEAFSHSLWGKPNSIEPLSHGLRGEESHVT